MSPTIFRYRGFRFFFFSREESRLHVHVQGARGEAKFWLEPIVKLVQNYGLTEKDLTAVERILKERKHEIIAAWNSHFGSRNN